MGKNEITVHCVKISDDPARHGQTRERTILFAQDFCRRRFSYLKSIEDVERGTQMRVRMWAWVWVRVRVRVRHGRAGCEIGERRKGR